MVSAMSMREEIVINQLRNYALLNGAAIAEKKTVRCALGM
jgi:hypothetical protein